MQNIFCFFDMNSCRSFLNYILANRFSGDASPWRWQKNRKIMPFGNLNDQRFGCALSVEVGGELKS